MSEDGLVPVHSETTRLVLEGRLHRVEKGGDTECAISKRYRSVGLPDWSLPQTDARLC